MNNGSLKLFVIIVAAVIIALVAFTVGKNLWDKHEAAAQEQQQRQEQQATQQKFATLQDLWKNQIGYADWNKNNVSTWVHDLKNNDSQKNVWALYLQTEDRTACSKLYPNQSQPMDGCDFQNRDGSWTYSLSYSETQKKIKDDADRYNSLAGQLDRSVLSANKLPLWLKDDGVPDPPIEPLFQ